MRRGYQTDVYDAFVKLGDDPAQPISWVGSVRSGDPELAWHAAKEIYTRREDATVLWVAQRSAMVTSGPEDLESMRTPSRLTYRLPGKVGRRRRARAKLADVQPVGGAEA